MADVYFLKDKERTATNAPAREVEIDRIISSFGLANFKFLSKDDISLTNEPPSEYDSRVVLFISDNESKKIPSQKTGFYVLDSVSAGLFTEKLFR